MSVEPTSLERSWNGSGLPLPAAPLKALHLRCVHFSSWVQGQNNTTSKCLCLIISVVSMPHFISSLQIMPHPIGMLQSKSCERLCHYRGEYDREYSLSSIKHCKISKAHSTKRK